MTSKKQMAAQIDCIDERVIDLYYEINVINKKLLDISARLDKLSSKQPKRKVGRPRKEEPKRKVGRPRKDAKRADFAKKK